MFIHNPSKKKKRGGQRILYKGPFLLLLRLKTEDNRPHGNDLRGLVKRVSLEYVANNKHYGQVLLNGRWMTIAGNFGNLGMPNHVPYEVWQLGTPLPDALYDLWNALYSADHIPFEEEFKKWGIALIRFAHKPLKQCYRCGFPYDTDTPMPCQGCANELRALAEMAKSPVRQSDEKPPPITIKPTGIESAEIVKGL